MSDWLLGIVTSLIGASAGWFAAFVTLKTSRKNSSQQLIDQLQEERNRYFDQLDKERSMYSEKLDKMWADKSASREHVAALREHIWQRKDPPPPDPPAGYIP